MTRNSENGPRGQLDGDGFRLLFILFVTWAAAAIAILEYIDPPSQAELSRAAARTTTQCGPGWFDCGAATLIPPLALVVATTFIIALGLGFHRRWRHWRRSDE